VKDGVRSRSRSSVQRPCRSAANAKVAFERTTAARSRGRTPAASRHWIAYERTGVAFGCCNGLLDGSRLRELAPTIRLLQHPPAVNASMDPEGVTDRVATFTANECKGRDGAGRRMFRGFDKFQPNHWEPRATSNSGLDLGAN
jgi:hypothetical protein